MTQENKKLLLQDLCSRLSYEVKVDHFGTVKELLGIIPSSEYVMVGYDINDYEDSVIENIKPYLRPMSNMTEEERTEFESLNWRVDELDFNNPWTPSGDIEIVLKGVKWLLKHHFDINGLIPLGLAIETTEKNNPYEKMKL